MLAPAIAPNAFVLFILEILSKILLASLPPLMPKTSLPISRVSRKILSSLAESLFPLMFNSISRSAPRAFAKRFSMIEST